MTTGEYFPSQLCPQKWCSVWSEVYGNALEDQLRQSLLMRPSLVVEGVTPRVAALSLRDRLMLYCLAVDGMLLEENQTIMNPAN